MSKQAIFRMQKIQNLLHLQNTSHLYGKEIGKFHVRLCILFFLDDERTHNSRMKYAGI